MWPELAQGPLKRPDASKSHSLAQKGVFCVNALPRTDSPLYSPSNRYVVRGTEGALLVLVAAASVAVTCFSTTQTGFPAAVVAVDVVCILAADVMVALVVDAVGRAALVVPVVATCVLVVDMLVALVLEFLDPTILGYASLVALGTILAAATCQTTTPLVVPVAVAADAKGGQSTSLSCVGSV